MFLGLIYRVYLGSPGSVASFQLDKHGFEIVNYSTALTYDDFSSDNIIYAHYFPESEAPLRKHLGVAGVFAPASAAQAPDHQASRIAGMTRGMGLTW